MNERPGNRPRVLFYYFGFPHYRKAILQELTAMESVRVSLVAGSSSRGGIAVLGAEDVRGLRNVKTRSFGPLTWDRGVLRKARGSRYDAVVLGPALSSLSTWATLIARRLVARPTYLWGQCGRVGDRSARRVFQEVMNRLATGLLVYGQAEAGAAGSLGMSPRKIHIVHNGTRSNGDSWSETRSREAFLRMRNSAHAASGPEGRMVLTFVGRLTRDKRLDVLLDAAEILSHDFRDVQVHIVGDGPMKSILQSRSDSVHVTLHGWVYDEADLNKILETSTLVVSPYHMGLLAVDALRCGVPVLVPDNPMCGSEVEALTAGVNSLRFTAGSPSDIAAKAKRWVELAPRVAEQDFVSARTSALRVWEPSSVATKILEAVVPPTECR